MNDRRYQTHPYPGECCVYLQKCGRMEDSERERDRLGRDKREKEVWIKRIEPHREEDRDYSLVSSFGIISTTELN